MIERLLLVGEFDIDPTKETAQDALDAFRERVLASQNGCVLTRATQLDVTSAIPDVPWRNVLTEPAQRTTCEAYEPVSALRSAQKSELERLRAQVARLEHAVHQLRIFAAAHERWEAAVLNDDSPWFDQMPDALRTGFDEAQTARNDAMQSWR